MAASSPVISNNGSDTGQTPILAGAGGSFNVPPKTLRGLNKPKCIQCGNVARSRCPYQSCKSCCSRAQNPCHIHVLKASATPEKTPAPSTPLFDNQANEPPPAVSSHRAASLRQLSSNFSQFNNLHSPLRSKKPLTRKEAAAINEWRFSKLKEFRDRNIEVENEAFDRYMHNIGLLEEVFSLKSFLECSTEDGSLSSNPDEYPAEDETKKLASDQKLKLRSNPIRSENIRKRLKQIVDEGLEKLQKLEANDSVNNQNELDKKPEKGKSGRAERTLAFGDLFDKLNKVRNEDDLKSCLEMKHELHIQQIRSSQTVTEDVEVLKEQTSIKDLAPQKELDYLSQELFRAVEIDHDALTSIDTHFCSLEKIEDL